MATAILKGLGIATAAGTATYFGLLRAWAPLPVTLATLSGFAAFLYYARVWIQA